MYHLRTFGDLSLEMVGGSALDPQPRRRALALLALLAVAGEQGLSRSRVLAYLWPESNSERARNNLKQTLFALRRNLSQPLLLPATSVLRLDPAAIKTDLAEFEDASARGNWLETVTSYRGPFLDGFYVPGLREFEHWAETERARLAKRYQLALETLAREAERRADLQGAVEWWRRLTLCDPLCERAGIGLMKSLAAVGDRAAALEYAREYERLVWEELQLAPDTRFTALVEELRRVPARSPEPQTVSTARTRAWRAVALPLQERRTSMGDRRYAIAVASTPAPHSGPAAMTRREPEPEDALPYPPRISPASVLGIAGLLLTAVLLISKRGRRHSRPPGASSRS
jgi:DNA-binding SARP family transcriptional activator